MKISPIVALALVLPVFAGCPSPEKEKPVEPANTGPKLNGLKDLKVEVLKPGTGDKAANGDILVMQYVGTLLDGTEFDKNMDQEDNPFCFTIGQGQVIKGWDEGLIGAQKGAELKLSIPSSKGYGEAGQGGAIPPNADLYFKVKCLDVVKKEDAGQVIVYDLQKGSGPVCNAGDTVFVSYELRLANGKLIDQIPESKPIYFRLGYKQSVQGVDGAIQGQTVGTKMDFRVPDGLLAGSYTRKLPPQNPAYIKMKILKKTSEVLEPIIVK